jgi:Transposase
LHSIEADEWLSLKITNPIFEQVRQTDGVVVEKGSGVALIRTLRQHHDTDLRVLGMDGTGGLDALHVVAGWHADIGQNRVRGESSHRIKQLARITNTGYDLDLPGVFQQTAYAFADQVVVLGDDHPQRPGQGKTDPVDAVAIARITARKPSLPPVWPMTWQAADLRVLTEYRDQLVNERTATANRVHTNLGWLRPGYRQQLPHLTNMAHLHTALQLLSGDDTIRATVTRSRLERMLTRTEQLRELRIEIDTLVRASWQHSA